MSMTKHTPWPWELHFRDGLPFGRYPCIHCQAGAKRGSTSNVIIALTNDTYEQRDSDAALIAAAPEMYEALEKVREDVNWMLNNRQFLNGDVFDCLDAALAKARGEA